MASSGVLPSLRSRFEREVDHHDGVLLDDADQQDDADQRNDIEILVEENQRGNARPRRPKAASKES